MVKDYYAMFSARMNFTTWEKVHELKELYYFSNDEMFKTFVAYLYECHKEGKINPPLQSIFHKPKKPVVEIKTEKKGVDLDELRDILGE